ncbi:MAG: DUF72 domain-containing protein [Cyanobacteria bacterium J06621_8]
MNFYLGCAVWSHKDWVGNFYPPKSQPRDFLNLYSQRLTTVEGNTTFYSVPSPQTINRWVEQTPPGFKFCPKLNRQITHQGLLVPRMTDADTFFQRLSGLGDRLGTIFMQLPPSYSPQYFADLSQFLQRCSQYGLSLALEVRHLDWFQPEVDASLNQLLKELNIARVLLDTRPIYDCPDDPQASSTRRKPKLPLKPEVIGDLTLIRFISHPHRQYNEAYLKQWTDNLLLWLSQGKTIYFFVHCPQEIYSPETAKYFYSLLKAREPSLTSLPWNTIADIPTQLTLF